MRHHLTRIVYRVRELHVRVRQYRVPADVRPAFCSQRLHTDLVRVSGELCTLILTGQRTGIQRAIDAIDCVHQFDRLTLSPLIQSLITSHPYPSHFFKNLRQILWRKIQRNWVAYPLLYGLRGWSAYRGQCVRHSDRWR